MFGAQLLLPGVFQHSDGVYAHCVHPHTVVFAAPGIPAGMARQHSHSQRRGGMSSGDLVGFLISFGGFNEHKAFYFGFGCCGVRAVASFEAAFMSCVVN